MTISINPGSGPVSGTYLSRENARANMHHFIADLRNRGHSAQHEATGDEESHGRWLFVLTVNEHLHLVEIPGLPLSRVRFMAEPDQSAWDYPRLYVDGSSWLWKYALDIVASGPGNELPCPDGGVCGHSCQQVCFRVRSCGPLSGVYPDDQWPSQIREAHQ